MTFKLSGDHPPKDKSVQYIVFWAMLAAVFFLAYCVHPVKP